MSRRMALAAGLAMVIAGPASAQDASYGPADERQASPAQTVSSPYLSNRPRERPSECDDPDPDPDTIVVCREWEEGTEYMLGERDRRMVGADVRDTAGGAPRAPDFDDSCLHNRGRENCMMGGSVPPPAIMVDFSELPETPPDSEAARLYGGPTADDALVPEEADQS